MISKRVSVFVLVLAFSLSSSAGAEITKQEAQMVLDTCRTISLPQEVSPKQTELLWRIVGLLRAGEVAYAKTAWEKFSKGYITYATAKNIPQIQNWVLNRTYCQPGSQFALEIGKWEDELQAVADGITRDQTAMQNALQRQAQAFQIMSNVQKSLHDAARAVIRNMR
jgi:hypothetical protein